MTLKDRLGSYFLGTDIRKDYLQQRSVYREFVMDPTTLERRLAASAQLERFEMFMCRTVPNAISATSVLLGTVAPESLIGIAFGETMRLSLMAFYAANKRDEQETKHHYEALDKMNRAADAAHVSCIQLMQTLRKYRQMIRSGEEWKQGISPDQGYSDRIR
jgi:hypothetical protein